MSSTLPVGNWVWHERWLYPDQIYDKPVQYAYQQQQQELANINRNNNRTSLLDANNTNTLTATATRIINDEKTQTINNNNNNNTTTNNNNNATNKTSSILPERPRRYLDGVFPRYTSVYSDTYRNPIEQDYATRVLHGISIPKPVQKHTLSHAAAGTVANAYEKRGLVKPTGCKHVQPNLRNETQKQLRPEQHSFTLWSRLNAAHCVIPYETESQRNYNTDTTVLSTDHQWSNKEYNAKMTNKAYTEALVKQKQIDVKGVHNDKNLKPFSHAKGVTI